MAGQKLPSGSPNGRALLQVGARGEAAGGRGGMEPQDEPRGVSSYGPSPTQPCLSVPQRAGDHRLPLCRRCRQRVSLPLDSSLGLPQSHLPDLKGSCCGPSSPPHAWPEGPGALTQPSLVPRGSGSLRTRVSLGVCPVPGHETVPVLGPAVVAPAGPSGRWSCRASSEVPAGGRAPAGAAGLDLAVF